MITMKSCNLIVAAVTLVIGAMIAYTSYGYGISMTMFGPGAGFWSFILGVGLIAVAVLIVIDTLHHSDEFTAIQVKVGEKANLQAYKLMVLSGVFVVLLEILGFYLDAFLFMCACMYLLGMRRSSSIISVALAFLAFIYVIFSLSLHINLPLPIFWS
ncbi:MAG: tripartite tricarboxylate transporter TctB family protein [Succinivibrio sp.]|nr:tripartite tricarboxylate transporter TctB family protein [Succinivibrio sp.]